MHAALLTAFSLCVPLLAERDLDARATATQTRPAERPVLVLRAKVLHLGDGRVIENGAVAISGGRIQAVGAQVPVPSGAIVVEHDGPLTPGFVLPHSNLVPSGEDHDNTRTAFPGARQAAAFRPALPEFEKARAAGVTAVVLAPSPRNAVGGQTAVVKTSGERVVVRASHLALSLTRLAADDVRPPTSHAGIVREIERHFAAKQGPFRDAAEGKLPVLVAADDRHEVVRALELQSRLGFRGALVGAPLAGELLESLEASGLGVVVAAPGPGSSRRVRASIAALGTSQVPFAFRYTDPDELRAGVAALLAAGVARERLEAALMATGARLAGVGGRLGVLERGAEADLVLWSGDPLDLASRPVAIYIDGERVEKGGQR